MRSESLLSCSALRPVVSESISNIVRLLVSTSWARIWMSLAWPRAPERGWCSTIDAWGRAALCPLAPAERIIAAVPIAWPMQIVCTGGFT